MRQLSVWFVALCLAFGYEVTVRLLRLFPCR
jgi:hypothetical protein